MKRLESWRRFSWEPRNKDPEDKAQKGEETESVVKKESASQLRTVGNPQPLAAAARGAEFLGGVLEPLGRSLWRVKMALHGFET